MFKNTEESLSGVPSGGEAFEWKENEAKKDTSLVKNTNISPPTTFKVYDKVSEKNRYIPRKWTQEEFEAALPQRFKEGSKKSNPHPIEDELANYKKQSPESSEETLPFPSTAGRRPRKKPEIKEKISNLKAIFEGVQNEDDCDQLSDTSNELKSCKESEANVILTNEQGSQEETTDGVIGGVKCKEDEHVFIESRHNAFTSFIDGCLQCLLNLEPISQSLIAPTAKTYSSFASDKLRTVLSSDKSSPEELQQLCLQDLFPKLYKEAQEQSKSCDEVLEFLLNTLIDGNHLRSVFEGKFCHSTVCERCATVVKEYQPFVFLNPVSPPSGGHTLQVNLFTCNNSVWQLSPKETSITPGMTVAGLKEELLNYPEFLGTRDVSAIELGEVNESCLDKVFDDTEDLLGLGRSLGTIVAFHVVNYHSELNHHSETDEDYPAKAAKSRSRGFADMSYHLYFNCGLCLNDGKEVGLLMHQSCGGMVCRDCLDEILQTNTGWELCPCPICERPINLDKEFCQTSMDANRNQDMQPQPDVVFGVVLRTAVSHYRGGSSVELFGCPLLVSLPQETSGFQLYRFIGYLLPKGLPMKNKTSFTLHKVDKSGLRCAVAGCSSNDCTGCLVRVNDNLTLQTDTCLAVHFDDLEEASKRDFGMNIHETARISKTQALFDGILRSCVEGCSSVEMLCPKCFNISQTTSSILKFPQLLIIHLNKQFAIKGLPTNSTIADVARFFTMERGNGSREDGKPGLMYQLRAAVLQPESSPVSMYQTCAIGANNKWTLYDGLQVNERHPTQLYLTSDSVLFYEPVTDPESQLNGEVRQFLQSTTVGEKSEGAGESNDSNHPAYGIYHRQLPDVNTLDPIAEGPHEAIKQQPIKEYSSTNNQVHNNVSFTLKSANSQLEPGEWFPGKDLAHDNNRRFPQPGVNYGSRLSLGEMERGRTTAKPRKGITVVALDNIDTISPIYTTDVWKSESRVIKETKKLVKAVKREDAYEIVCSLNRGADPCLAINDVSALHLAAGIKSDQRRCIVTYLLRYCSDDINVPTADGTTPIHVAAAWGHQDALELLLLHGGDPFELTDLEGYSAFDMATNDCSTYLQSVYHGQHSTRPLELSSSSYASHRMSHLSKRSLKDENVHRKEQRLEDLVRSNVCLPSFVEDHTHSTRIRRRWIHRLRNFRERSSGVFRSLRKISRIRRRSRIGVMVMETALEKKSNEDNLHLKTSTSLI